MKTCIAVVLAISLILVLLPYPAHAQPGVPPAGLPGASVGGHARSLSGPAPFQLPAAAAAPVPLGKPGLSFRYVQTFGVTEEAYPGDVQHLNGPNGLAVDAKGNVYVVEERGARLLKYNPSGGNLLAIGKAGFNDTSSSTFNGPKHVALDAGGNAWVADNSRVMQFNDLGELLQSFPDPDHEWWNCAGDNGHFCEPRGIAFDKAGRMYVSDHWNHRVQVFEMSSGHPVYAATIGVAGEAGAGADHFNAPSQIVFDSLGRLYVADTYNHRVQRCTANAGGWACETFHGTGSEGDGAADLRYPFGVGADTSGNIFILDSGNGRVKKCSNGGTCSVFASGMPWVAAVAVSPDGSIVYVSDYNGRAIRKYSPDGLFTGAFAGTPGVPYMADSTRIYTPWGVAVTPDGGIVVSENQGYRVVKFDAAGAQQWSLGQAGVGGNDNEHLASPEGSAGVDAQGRIYVPDTGNDRIQILGADGRYLSTFGSGGQGQYEFACPTGVAFHPTTGDMYVVDHCNHRIQIFTKDRVYKTTIGRTGERGIGLGEFSAPWGVAVDAQGVVFVADTENHRVQRCAPNGASYTCSLFAGTGTDQWTNSFGDLSCPRSMAVDNAGNVYVADDCATRVQVFDRDGAYVASIGASWGNRTGQSRSPSGVAVDSRGNVYVTDTVNHRVQKYAAGVPGWRQVNINGFGNVLQRGVSALEVFDGRLYAGTQNWDGIGAEIWRTSDAINWAEAIPSGFNAPAINAAILDMVVFNGRLYASTGWGDGSGQLWRTATGDAWNRVEGNGFGTDSDAIGALSVWNSQIYACTVGARDGVSIWRSATGDAGSWTPVAAGGLGDLESNGCTGFDAFNGYLYAAVDHPAGPQVWRSSDGANWSIAAGSDVFGSEFHYTSGLTLFNGALYVGTSNHEQNGQIWRSFDGLHWERVGAPGLGDPNNYKADGMYVYQGQLYAMESNWATGLEVWRTSDGVSWRQVSPDGFGDSTNQYTKWSSATTTFGGRLYIGTHAPEGAGGRIWRYEGATLFLPLLKR